MAAVAGGKDGGAALGAGREYLDTPGEAAWDAAGEAKPKFVSRSDPPRERGAHAGRPMAASSLPASTATSNSRSTVRRAMPAILRAEAGSAIRRSMH